MEQDSIIGKNIFIFIYFRVSLPNPLKNAASILTQLWLAPRARKNTAVFLPKPFTCEVKNEIRVYSFKNHPSPPLQFAAVYILEQTQNCSKSSEQNCRKFSEKWIFMHPSTSKYNLNKISIDTQPIYCACASIKCQLNIVMCAKMNSI